MKSVLMSIQPKWCELIANGKKTIEIRKTKPKLETPFKVYIYCTLQGSDELFQAFKNSLGENKALKKWYIENWSIKKGKVIGEFVCDKVFNICIEISKPDDLPGYPFPYTGLTDKEILQYLGNGRTGYGWHISDLVIYDKPKELSEFRKSCALSYDDWLYGIYNGNTESTYDNYLAPFRIKRPPQSWYYVEELSDNGYI